MKNILANLNDVINKLENSGDTLSADKLNEIFIKVSNKFDAMFTDPVRGDKDKYQDWDLPDDYLDHMPGRPHDDHQDVQDDNHNDPFSEFAYKPKKKPFTIRRKS